MLRIWPAICTASKTSVSGNANSDADDELLEHQERPLAGRQRRDGVLDHGIQEYRQGDHQHCLDARRDHCTAEEGREEHHARQAYADGQERLHHRHEVGQ